MADWPKYFFNAVLWQARKRLGHVFIAALPNGARVKVYPSSAYSGMFYQPWAEGSDLRFIRMHSALADTFVDVGANVGLISAMLVDKFRDFVCFEPAPSSFRALCETASLNPKVHFELHNVGIGDAQSSLDFLDEGDYSSTSRFVPEKGNGTIRVPVDTLDHVLGSRYSSLVMKIDVEGFEEKVFAGADRLFREKLVRLVMFERLGRSNLAGIRGFLETRQYVVFRVRKDLSVTTDDHEISAPCINLFACPRETLDLLLSRTAE